LEPEPIYFFYNMENGKNYQLFSDGTVKITLHGDPAEPDFRVVQWMKMVYRYFLFFWDSYPVVNTLPI